MQTQIDLTDVPYVSPYDMTVPMQAMIEAGRGLVLLNGATAAELRRLDRSVWDRLDASPDVKMTVLLRFRSLIEVFAAPRLKALLLQKGFNLLAPALHVAATQRLNAERGFNAVKFERVLLDLVDRLQAREAETLRAA